MEKVLLHNRPKMVEKLKNNDIYNKGQDTAKFKTTNEYHPVLQLIASWFNSAR